MFRFLKGHSKSLVAIGLPFVAALPAYSLSLVSSSPFLPPGTVDHAEVPATEEDSGQAYELCGVYQIRDTWAFGLHEKSTGKRFWITTARVDERFRIDNFDTQHNRLSLFINGQRFLLGLIGVRDPIPGRADQHVTTAGLPVGGAVDASGAVGPGARSIQTNARPVIEPSRYRGVVVASGRLPVAGGNFEPAAPIGRPFSNTRTVPTQAAGAETPDAQTAKFNLPPRYSENAKTLDGEE